MSGKFFLQDYDSAPFFPAFLFSWHPLSDTWSDVHIYISKNLQDPASLGCRSTQHYT